jgi:hypothetical protein
MYAELNQRIARSVRSAKPCRGPRLYAMAVCQGGERKLESSLKLISISEGDLHQDLADEISLDRGDAA